MGSCKEKKEEPAKCVWVHGPIIVGAGPSGLAASACLSEHGVPSVILERSNCIASLWQLKTYDRLKLHLPKQFCALPLLGFPENFPKYPTKGQFISYMESYAAHFSIQPRFNQAVQSAEFDSTCGFWRVRTQDLEYISRWFIVATGENAEPVIPEIVGMERFHGPVVHTSAYKSGSDFANQKVLVVGCGNSGMEISLDLCRHNAVPHMVVRNTVHVLPREMLVDKFLLLVSNFTVGNTDQLGLHRPKTGPIELKNVTGKTPVLDVGALSQIRSGKIKVMEGVKEITRNGARFMDGQEKEFDSIILATGYKSNVPSWLRDAKTPFPNGLERRERTVYSWLHKRGLLGTSYDAVKIANDIADEWRTMRDCRTYCNAHIILLKNCNKNKL
ncbi:hypothetical protein SLA2020_487810 [Shorea laevis]